MPDAGCTMQDGGFTMKDAGFTIRDSGSRISDQGLAIRQVLLLIAITATPVFAQGVPGAAPAPAAPQAAQRPQAPRFTSPEVATDRRITFRLYAPQAQAVRLAAGDIPGTQGAGAPAPVKGENRVWEVTVGPVEPGAYRYTFNVDGVATIDPPNPSTSESNNNTWSLVAVPGSDLWDTRDVPHGAVAAVTYKSSALGRFRRMHVYTPPGYELGRETYPVFYLLHGAGDSDDSWGTVGRAGFILDNLIATKQARPMVVVMPAGHTPGVTGSAVGRTATENFVNDFVGDVMPYVESHYRVLKDRSNTAIAGLSMGGTQTLAVSVPRLERFGYIGVFSSGLIGAFPQLAAAARGAAPTPAPAATTAPAAAAPAAAQTPTAEEWEKTNA